MRFYLEGEPEAARLLLLVLGLLSLPKPILGHVG